MSYAPGLARVAAVDQQLMQRDEFLAEVRERLLQAQDYMKTAHDKNHRDLSYDVSEWAWLRLHHRSAAGITDKTHAKLPPKYYGPFQVVERVGPVAYRLSLPPKSRIHDVFHVVFLKKFHGAPPTQVAHLPPIVHGRVLPRPAKVLRERPSLTSWDILVQWEGLDASEASWRPLEEFKEEYPNFKLEDELFCHEGGSVMDTFFGKKFQRRRSKTQAPSSG